MPGPVLIIEDDPTFAEGAQQALEAAGFVTQISYNPGLEPIRSVRPQLVVLGATLGGGRSGFSLCSRIRRDPALRETPVFIVSGPSQTQTAESHAESQDRADGYLTKDQPLADLVRDTRKLLKTAPPPPRRAKPPPPPLPTGNLPLRPTTEAESPEELWPQKGFEASLRRGAGAELPPPSGRGLEDRVAYLRKQVGQLESAQRNFSELWAKASERGQELARKVFSMNTELKAREEALLSAEARIEEFRRFDEKVRAIAEEKDEEERALWEQLHQLKAREAELSAALDASETQRGADAARVQVLEQELDQQAHLAPQLETTAAVAKDQAEQVEALRLQLDELALQAQTERAQLIESHRAELKQAQDKQVELQAALEAARAERGAAAQAEGVAREAEQERGAALQAELASERARAQALERELNNSRDLASAHAVEVESLTEAQARLDQTNTALVERLDQVEDARGRAEVRVSELEHELSSVQVSLSGDIQQAQQQAGRLELQEEELRTLRAALDRAVEEVDDRENEVAQLTAELTALREAGGAGSADVAELQAEIQSQEERFARAEQLIRKARARIQELEDANAQGAARIEELQLVAEQHEGAVSSLEEELLASAGSFAELKATEQQLREQLEAERAAGDRVESLLSQAKEKLGSFQNDLQSGRLERERLNEQLSRAIGELQQLHRSKADLQSEHDRLSQDLVVERDLRAQMEGDAAAQAVEEAREQVMELQAQLDHERAATRALKADLSSASEARGQLEAELAQLQASGAEGAAPQSQAELQRRVTHMEEQFSQWRFAASSVRSTLESLHADVYSHLDGEDRGLPARVSQVLLRSLDDLQEVEELSSRIDLDASGDLNDLLAEIDQLPQGAAGLGQSLPMMLVDEEDRHNTQVISRDALKGFKPKS